MRLTPMIGKKKGFRNYMLAGISLLKPFVFGDVVS